MYLVAGLAVAGLLGIAAAFYFSIRSGKGGNKRLRPAGAGRTGVSRAAAGRGGAGRGGSGRAARASSRDYQPEDDSETTPSLDFGDPVLVGGRRGGRGASAGSRTGSDGRQTGARAAEPASSRRPGDRFEPDESQATGSGLVAAQVSESRPGNRTTGLSREAGDREAE